MVSFCNIKSDELVRRVQHCETSVESIIENNSQIDISQFEIVSGEIENITADVSELSKFIRLNYSAFLKVF